MVGRNINIIVAGSGKKIQGRQVEAVVPLFVDRGHLANNGALLRYRKKY